MSSRQENSEEHNQIATVNSNTPMIKESSTDEPTTDEPKCCPGCTRKVTVRSIEDINKGDHICYRPSKYSPYRHHAIVENVYKETETLDLIHFTRLDGSVSRSFFGDKFKIQKTSVMFGEMNCLKLVKYPDGKRFAADETIEKATEEMEKKEEVNYSIFTFNCEHLCYQSTIDYKSSKQVQSCLRMCGLYTQFCFFFFAWLFRYFAKFIIIAFIDIARGNAENTARILLLVVSLLLFVFCLIKSFRCCESQKCQSCFPERCDNCFKRHRCIRWLRFCVFVILQWLFLYVEMHYIKQEKNYLEVFSIGIAAASITLIFISIVPCIVRFCNRYCCN